MTPDNRAVFDSFIALAKTGNATAIKMLRTIGKGLCDVAPPETLISVIEAFNDHYTDEQIEYARQSGDASE